MSVSRHDNLPRPQKEAVQFQVNLRGAPDEIIQLVQNIKQVGEQFLYHWKTFPIVLPSPVNATVPNGDAQSGTNGDNNSVPSYLTGGGEGCCTLARRANHRPSSLRELFVAPSFDELDAVAVDTSGEPRRLTAKQLESLRERGLHKDKYGKPKPLNANQLANIRRTGEFEVASLNFPGQLHRWQLSGLLQKGTERTRDSLLDDLALALRFLLVTARARFVSHFFSISQAFNSLITGALKLLDILIGVPSLLPHNLEGKLREERCYYLVAELVCRPEFEDALELLCSFVRRQMRRAATEKFEVEKEASQPPVPIPYLFLTPKGVELDLRLYSKDTMKRALPTLVDILEKETRGWFLHFRERLISELRQQKLPDEDIEKEVNEAVMREYLQKVFTSMLGSRELHLLGEGIPELLVQQAQSVVLMHRAVENVEKKLKKMKDSLKRQLEHMHPILSRIGPWMRDRLRHAEDRFIEECKWSAHEEALSLCNDQHLHQTVYFLHRDLIFMKEREPVLLKELKKVKTPTRSFSWRTQIWLPRNWVIRRCFQGHSEVIPTVMSSTATSITTPRSDPSQPVFLVEKEIVRTSTTRWPFWRWINYCHRTWSWTWNAMFFFGVVIPWCSPVSLRALICLTPFTSDLELSQVNGTLFPRKSSLTPTLASRLLTLWRHISKSRTHFETKPDTGFIGKGMTRHANRVWNYAGKGFLGTMGIVLVLPLVCLVVSGLSILMALTAFIWMPLVTLVLQVFMGLVYDVDRPVGTRNQYVVVLEAVLWDVIVCALIQPLLALAIALIICPLISFTIVTVGVLRCWFRLSWDAAMFHLIIKKRGRIPACDSIVVKRTHGPGLTNNFFFQIRPEQALAAFEAKLELDELVAYQHQMEQLILQPQKDFSQFVEACFGPFSCSLARVGAYKKLEREGQDLLNSLHEKLDKRRRELQSGLAPTVRAKLRLTQLDLKIAIQQGALMLERFYPSRVMSRWGETLGEEEFWETKGLCSNEWDSLASLMYADIFSLDFLTPLDDSDTKFKLEPSPQVDLSRYTDLVRMGAGNVDLLGHVYAPRGNIQVYSPYMDVTAFNPRQKRIGVTNKHNRDATSSSGVSGSTMVTGGSTMAASGTAGTVQTVLGVASTGEADASCTDMLPCWGAWKRTSRPYNAEKLLIPLPVPHPAHIAVTIHNRDTEDVIPLESDICHDILRAIEESTQEVTEAVARYRGGAGAESSFDSVDTHSSDSVAAVANEESSSPPSRQPGPTPNPASVDEVTHKNKRPQHWDPSPTSFNWRRAEWSAARNAASGATGIVHVDLASPEDVTLDTDSTRVIFSSYGTTV